MPLVDTPQSPITDVLGPQRARFHFSGKERDRKGIIDIHMKITCQFFLGESATDDRRNRALAPFVHHFSIEREANVITLSGISTALGHFSGLSTRPPAQ